MLNKVFHRRRVHTKLKQYATINFKILFFLPLFLLNIPLCMAYDLKEYYPLGQGNSWTYSVITDEEREEKLFRINGNEVINNVETVIINTTENEYDCFAVDSEGVKQYKYFEENRYGIFNPPRMFFPNLEIAEEKEYSTKLISYSSNGKKIEEFDVTDRILLESTIDDIKISAGEFNNCLKFSVITNWNSLTGKHGVLDCMFWLAAGVGKVKQSCIYTEYDVETKEGKAESEIYELISAVVDGKKIGQ